MDTKAYGESEYITAQLVKDSPTKKAIILSDARSETVEFMGKKSDRLTLEVEIDGKRKSYRPNTSTIKNVQGVLGFESKAWLGKTLVFQVINVSGKESVIGMVAK